MRSPGEFFISELGSNPRNHAERIVKLVLESALPGAELAYRAAQSHGEYDFDLHYANGTVAAVEVTESTDQLQRWTSAKIRNKKEGGSILLAEHCKKSWMILPMKEASAIPVIRKKADEYLAKVEQAGLENFHCRDAWQTRQEREAGLGISSASRVPRCVEDICYELNVVSGSVIAAGSPPSILIAHPVGGGTVGARVAIEAGEHEAWKDDNRKKLRDSKTDERHMAVYMGAALPSMSLIYFDPPSALPNIPEEMTDIWLIGHSEEVRYEFDEFVVWRASTKEPWSGQRVVIPRATPAL